VSTLFFDGQQPFEQGYVDTGDGYQLHFERYGNSKGKPVVILHGGPGYGSNPRSPRFFDPEKWNVLVFDQRGTGLSKPLGSLINNTTPHLISDITLLAKYVSMSEFVLMGESWGTTLALAYAQKNPQKVESLILTGVFLGEDNESLLSRADGVQRHFPEHWDCYIKALPIEAQADPINAYYQRIMSGNNSLQKVFCKEAIILELATEAMGVSRKEAIETCERLDYINIAKIEYHYLKNRFFLKPGQLLNSCALIENVPVTIIHGRYDMVCPPESAWKLHNTLKNSTLIFSEPAGHSTSELITSNILLNTVQQHLLLQGDKHG
jgi:proline iminopeptidase